MKKGFSYLGGKYWSEITRDERTFCADLYMVLQDKDKLRTFTNWLIQECNLGEIDTSNEIEVGFEVALLRDVLFDYELTNKQKAANKIKIKGALKRTLDLAIFLPNDIIIIEAKAAESITNKQMNDFIKDDKAINLLLSSLERKSPNIHLVGLVSGEYKFGAETKKNFNNRIITWNAIENAGIGYNMPEKLKDIYSNTALVKRSPKFEDKKIVTLVDEIEKLYMKK